MCTNFIVLLMMTTWMFIPSYDGGDNQVSVRFIMTMGIEVSVSVSVY